MRGKVRDKQVTAVADSRDKGRQLNRRDFEIVAVRTHTIDGKSGLEERYAPRRFVGVIDACPLAQPQLMRVINETVEPDTSTDILEVAVV